METTYIIIIIIVIILLLSSSSLLLYIYWPSINGPNDMPIGTVYMDTTTGTKWTIIFADNMKQLKSNRTYGDTYATVDESKKTLTFLPSNYSTQYTITSAGFTTSGDTFTKQ